MVRGRRQTAIPFVVALASDIRLGRTTNPILGGYWMSCMMWDKLGISLKDEGTLPWQMVDDIKTMIMLETREEEARRKKAEQQSRKR